MSYKQQKAQPNGRTLRVSSCLSLMAGVILVGACGGGSSTPSPSGAGGPSGDSGATAAGVTSTAGSGGAAAAGGPTLSNTTGVASTNPAVSSTGASNTGVAATTGAADSTGAATTGSASTTGGTNPCPEIAIQCPDRCSNIQIDPYNCGGCGNQCGDGQACVDGVCGEPPEVMCLEQFTNCGGLCRDTNTAPDNCGECFNVCPTGQICRNGACDCSTTQLLCDDACIDPKTSNQHCGTCGNSCSGAENCVDGFCLDPASLDCGGSPTDNTCTNYQQNQYNKYFLFNNWWGAEEQNAQGEQCMWLNCAAGDLVGWGTSWEWPNTSGVKSYTALVLGWHWGWPVDAAQTGLPVQVASDQRVTCGWSFDVNASGAFAVAYDLWTHTTPNPGNVDPSDEIMIWLYQEGSVGPIGTHQATADIGGVSWDLYRGPGGASWEVFSFIRSSNTTTAVLDITAFTDDLVNRNWMQNNKYLVSIEAGPEVSGGSGEVNTNGFYCRNQ